MVLLDDALILHRHLPTRERDHLAAERDMSIKKGRAEKWDVIHGRVPVMRLPSFVTSEGRYKD
jgi:hypothetical protein